MFLHAEELISYIFEHISGKSLDLKRVTLCGETTDPSIKSTNRLKLLWLRTAVDLTASTVSSSSKCSKRSAVNVRTVLFTTEPVCQRYPHFTRLSSA